MTDFVITTIGSGRLADLEVLTRWLADEPELRGMIEPREAVPRPGELGALADVLVAALGGGGAISVLTGSLKTFLTQPRGQHVQITVTKPDGTIVELNADRVRTKSAHDLTELLRAVTDDKQ